MKMFDSIDSLRDDKWDWNLRVRVVRVWDSYSSKAGKEFRGKNLLLLDDKQARIHAFIWPNNIQDIKCDIKEGDIYTIRNVQVKSYRGDAIRCIQSDKQLWFSGRTKMEPLQNYDHMIPKNAFDFYNFADLGNLPQTLPKSQLIDVVGFLVEHEYNIRKITNTNDVEQIQLRFVLADGRGNIAKFCFWDTFAVSFDSAVKEQSEKPIIVIVSSCRYNLFKDEVHLSNLPPTTFFLNYEHHSVEHLRERCKEGSLIFSTAEEEVFEVPQIFTLASIQKLPYEYIEKSVMCQITITTIEEKSSWWYLACTKCHERVKKTGDDYYCEECKRIIPYPAKSFTLCVNVTDESGAAAMLLDDREVQRIVGKNVYEVLMIQKKSENKDSFPKFLKSIEEKQYTCTIKLTESNIKQRSCMYTVADIFEGFEMVDNSEKEENSIVQVQSSEAFPTMSENQSISVDSFSTPGTNKSTTLKQVKRKIENVVVDNMTSLTTPDANKNDGKKIVTPVILKNIKKEHDSSKK